MSQELVRAEAGAVSVAPGFTEEQKELLKNTVCKGATDLELKLFMEVCRAKRLDPFSKQIHAVKRWAEGREVMSFQTGIDGYRLIAERTGQYRGQDAPMWCGEDGQWKEVWASPKPPFAARAAVYREGFEKPVVRIARYSAYVQTKREGGPNAMWAKMGPEQLHKCAEALALRAAFPEELSSFYTNEEMGQADNEDKRGSRDAQKAVAEAKIAEMKRGNFNDDGVNGLGVHEAEFMDPPALPPAPEAPPEDMAPILQASIDKAEADKFKALAAFQDLKAEIIKQTGSDAKYYEWLGNEGYLKSNEIPRSKLRAVWKSLSNQLCAWKGEQPPAAA